MLSDTTNTQSDNSISSPSIYDFNDESSSSHRHRSRQRHLSTLNTIRRHKNELKRRNTFIQACANDKQMKVIIEPLEDIQSFVDGKYHSQTPEEQAKLKQTELQRKIYNNKQAPLIPFIMDDQFQSLMETALSSQQNDLLCDIMTLLNSMEEYYSSSEQLDS
ncbi:unnamed protein product [Adineta steineri]|uniref:Uncharacterized protein n=1 Tax=Adineta steineri TaxID=433720 RepID=A0A818WVY0_9BILA|nr:unnamed protein product [Adineta steineri]CAF3731945.1 unnamed protein product [Adineta steineri]CAF3731986.1 unnamed protein product [Adineta steineri]